MASEFYVPPGNDYSAGLSGLSSTLANVRQGRMQMRAEEEQKQRQAEASAAAQQAYESGDPDMMAKVSLQYPEIAQNLHQVVGLNDERKVKEAAGFARDLLLASPDQREVIFQKRIQSLQDQGRDPTHTGQAYQQYLQDPNGAMQGIELDWAAGDPNGYSVIANKAKAEAQAARDARKESREDRKLDQQMTIAQMGSADRALSRQIAMLTAQQGATMNDLKRQEIQQKIETTSNKAQQVRADLQATATSAVSTFDDTLQTINDIRNAPGLAGNFGKRSYLPNIRGSDSANAASLIDNLKGKAFLAAFQSLKGGGQITEVEGTKATNAMANLESAQSVEQFNKNLDVLERAIRRGRDVAKNQYGKYLDKDSSGAKQSPPAGASGGWEIIQ